jgi:hypothetical protein
MGSVASKNKSVVALFSLSESASLGWIGVAVANIIVWRITALSTLSLPLAMPPVFDERTLGSIAAIVLQSMQFSEDAFCVGYPSSPADPS